MAAPIYDFRDVNLCELARIDVSKALIARFQQKPEHEFT
jgi:hypothetical protein